MKPTVTAILSSLVASACCIGPLILIVVGLGGLGIGAAIGKYHWYFILAAAVLLGVAWRSYFKEKKTCESNRCEMEGKNITRNVLILASAVVLAFAGLNLYTYAKASPKGETPIAGTQALIPVEGMTCFTCEVAVQLAVKKLPGVIEVKASAKRANASVVYDPGEVSLDEIVQAINQTGYKAARPQGQGG